MIGIICVLVLPVPPLLLDMLLGISITIAVLILMTALVRRQAAGAFLASPPSCSSRRSCACRLNVATVRLVLSHGHEGAGCGGTCDFQAFGGFVAGGSVLIGAIVFGILTIINFVVITKGSGRIAEVSARFSLDAMPGKQM